MNRVLFVCVGNSCRSQMAEGFARVYGSDVIQARSAGLAPAASISPPTVQVMEEKNIRLEGQFPKSITDVLPGEYDLIVNMSGFALPFQPAAPVEVWKIRDPIGEDDTLYRAVRDEIEMRVMQLILGFRRRRADAGRRARGI